MHTGKELEAHKVEKGPLSCDSDAPQVGSARSDWTRVVNVNRRQTNRRKTRPYCIVIRSVDCVYIWQVCYVCHVSCIFSLLSLRNRHEMFILKQTSVKELAVPLKEALGMERMNFYKSCYQ